MLAFLFFAVLTAITAASYVPFNNARYLNDTLFREYVESKLAEAPATGWTSILWVNTPHQAWPAKDGIVYIDYCYHSQRDWHRWFEVAEGAAKMWSDKVGKPSKRNGHRFGGFREYKRERICRDSAGKWRSFIPSETLEIRSATDEEGGPFSAATGYTSKNYDDTAGRHFVAMYNDGEKSLEHYTVELAHEFGHVLGMVHEHQRYDRDTYVHFDCTKLAGYAEAKKTWDEKHEAERWPSMDIICASNWMGRRYLDWNAPAEYSMDMGATLGHKNPQQYPFDYDYKSIMGYESWLHSAIIDDNPAHQPLVAWNEPAPGKRDKVTRENAHMIMAAWEISDDDAQFVGLAYHWWDE